MTEKVEKVWLYAPDAIIDSALVTNVQLDGGDVSNYFADDIDALKSNPVRLLIGGNHGGGLNLYGLSASSFPSLSYYGDDIHAALDAIEDCGLYPPTRVQALRKRYQSMQESYDRKMAETTNKKMTSA